MRIAVWLGSGTPSAFGDLPLSLAYSKGMVESIREYWTDKDGKETCVANGNITAEVFAAVCIAKRRDDPIPIETFFTMDEARKADLLKNPVWSKYPKRMLRYRARSQALKDKFPDALNGLAIAEYDYNIAPESAEAITIDIEPTVADKKQELETAREEQNIALQGAFLEQCDLADEKILKPVLQKLGITSPLDIYKVKPEKIAQALTFLTQANKEKK